jgi:hypothetical protein
LIIRHGRYIAAYAFLASGLIGLAQALTQRGAYKTRQRLAERERRVASQLSFSE